MATRIHLDTDLGGDMDDLAALAMLLADPDVELVGVTTSADAHGRRAALVEHALQLAGKSGIPVASGAFGFLGGSPHDIVMQDERYWPGVTAKVAGPLADALNLLVANAQLGATVVVIGPFTNIAILETLRPGSLGKAPLVVMGGYVDAPPAGLPQWGAAMDYNVQADRLAARIVFERLDPLIVPLGMTVQTWLRGEELPRLRAGGPLARLVARQGELHRQDWKVERLAAANPGLPQDLLNFQHDPLACAAALGWDCLKVTELPLALATENDGSLRFARSEGGNVRRVVTAVDSARFSAMWIARTERV